MISSTTNESSLYLNKLWKRRKVAKKIRKLICRRVEAEAPSAKFGIVQLETKTVLELFFDPLFVINHKRRAQPQNRHQKSPPCVDQSSRHSCGCLRVLLKCVVGKWVRLWRLLEQLAAGVGGATRCVFPLQDESSRHLVPKGSGVTSNSAFPTAHLLFH